MNWSGAPPICALPAYADCDAELIDAVLEAAGRFAGDILSPLNPVGDREGARWLAVSDGKGEVRTAPGFADAYRHFADVRCGTGCGCRPGLPTGRWAGAGWRRRHCSA